MSKLDERTGFALQTRDERGERCDLVIPDSDPESSYAVLHKAMPQQVRYDIADLYRF
ncbi:MAG: hypothetical protein IKN03_07660 [Fibrobacter sp.]|nr:hypothetical protein [Fibrobacter sp.]